jgi:hypothetical protein
MSVTTETYSYFLLYRLHLSLFSSTLIFFSSLHFIFLLIFFSYSFFFSYSYSVILIFPFSYSTPPSTFSSHFLPPLLLLKIFFISFLIPLYHLHFVFFYSFSYFPSPPTLFPQLFLDSSLSSHSSPL